MAAGRKGHGGDAATPQDGTQTHAWLSAAAISAADAYRLMTDLVSPRPIAWVSTVDAQGRRNLAPFSYFQAVCSAPPTVVLGLAWRADGTPKDTLANILAQREFTISHVDGAHVDAMNRTSADVGSDIDEWLLAEPQTGPEAAHALDAAPSHGVVPPRVAGARAALECRLVHAMPLGRGPRGNPSSTLVVGEVVGFVVERGLLHRDARGRLQPIDPGQLDSVGRMGGIAYTTTRDRFERARPPTDAPSTRGNGGM